MPWSERVLAPIKPPLGAFIGTSLGRWGTDVTAAATRRSCLVLAPHPDDETLGCATSIMRRNDAGTPVHVMVVTDGRTWPPHKTADENIATRDAELRASCQVMGLGTDDVTHLSFREQELAQAGPDLVDAISDALRRWQPEDVLTTSEADPNEDHAALGVATRRALAGTTTRLLAYPVWQWPTPRSWQRTLRASSRPQFVRIGDYLERKRRAVAVYRSQLASSAGGELVGGFGLTTPFLRHFLGEREMFFPVAVDAAVARGAAS
jgi:LmbE family N-acetylglucosaminyl deacetylase